MSPIFIFLCAGCGVFLAIAYLAIVLSRGKRCAGDGSKPQPATPAENPPVAPTTRTSLTTDRNDLDLHKTRPNGQNEKYLVLSGEERAKGFVRPLRTAYRHLACGSVTRMGLVLSETYARDPLFYGATFCVSCGTHFPLLDAQGERTFLWDEDGRGVGE